MGPWSGTKSLCDRPLLGRTVANAQGPAVRSYEVLPDGGLVDRLGVTGSGTRLRARTALKPRTTNRRGVIPGGTGGPYGEDDVWSYSFGYNLDHPWTKGVCHFQATAMLISHRALGPQPAGSCRCANDGFNVYPVNATVRSSPRRGVLSTQ